MAKNDGLNIFQRMWAGARRFLSFFISGLEARESIESLVDASNRGRRAALLGMIDDFEEVGKGAGSLKRTLDQAIADEQRWEQDLAHYISVAAEAAAAGDIQAEAEANEDAVMAAEMETEAEAWRIELQAIVAQNIGDMDEFEGQVRDYGRDAQRSEARGEMAIIKDKSNKTRRALLNLKEGRLGLDDSGKNSEALLAKAEDRVAGDADGLASRERVVGGLLRDRGMDRNRRRVDPRVSKVLQAARQKAGYQTPEQRESAVAQEANTSA